MRPLFPNRKINFSSSLIVPNPTSSSQYNYVKCKMPDHLQMIKLDLLRETMRLHKLGGGVKCHQRKWVEELLLELDYHCYLKSSSLIELIYNLIRFILLKLILWQYPRIYLYSSSTPATLKLYLKAICHNVSCCYA